MNELISTWLIVLCVSYGGDYCTSNGGITAKHVTKEQCLAMAALRKRNYETGVLVRCFDPNGVEFAK